MASWRLNMRKFLKTYVQFVNQLYAFIDIYIYKYIYIYIVFLIKPIDALIFSNLFLSRKSTWFGQFLCPSSGVLHCTFGTGLCHASLMTAFEDIQDGKR